MLSFLQNRLATPGGSGAVVGAASRGAPKTTSLSRQVVLLCLGLCLPILLFGGAVVWEYASSEQERLRDETLEIAQHTALAVDRELAGLRSASNVVALSAYLRADDFAGFHGQLSELLDVEGITAVLRSPSGQQLVNPHTPFGEPLPVISLPIDQEVIATQQPGVTDLFRGAVTGVPFFSIVRPILRDGEVRYLLSLSLPVERIREVVVEQGAPEGWTVAVVDRSGVILARNQQHDDFVGQAATADLQASTQGQQGTWHGLTADGQKVFAAYTRSQLSDWRVAVGVRESDLAAPLTRSMWFLAALGAGLFLLSALLASLVSRRITAPVQELRVRAAALGRGEVVGPLATPLKEVADVGAALAKASHVLRTRENELRASEGRLTEILESIHDFYYVLDGEFRFLNVNGRVEEITGRPRAELIGRKLWDVFPKAAGPEAYGPPPPKGERRVVHREVYSDVLERWVEATLYRTHDSMEVFFRDVSQRKLAEEQLQDLNATLEQRIAEALSEREKVEAQLRQAQKMEAVGRLTGGVAHDFNNLLTVVTGNLDMLTRRVADSDHRTHRLLANALEGAKRAASLTHRLLAFSRQSPLKPERVDPNRLVSGMSDLLGRTLGEHIAIETVLGGGLWPVLADANQLESAVLNLAVNARDAMPEGGKLTIETANCHLDEAYAQRTRGEVSPGQYVMIAVSDSGSGMSAEVLAKAFEPFFTTKPVGKGTGLGLAQVYGFAKQSGGHAAIYSEPGEGTTVKLYFPRLKRAEEQRPDGSLEETAGVSPDTGSGELILVVEDDAMVREFAVSALEEAGYSVIAAEDGPSALACMDRHIGEIDLLFTDVVLSGPMNGRNVADDALRRRPDLKVLFTTGYTRNAIVHHGRLDEGVELLTKPFTARDLLSRVRILIGSTAER